MAGEPMTSERLTEIESRIDTLGGFSTSEPVESYELYSIGMDLLAEVYRLRAENEQLQMRVNAEYHDRVTLEQSNGALAQQVAAMHTAIAAVVAAQDIVKSAEMRWHQVTRTDSYPESEVRQADRKQVMALRARDEAIEQARAFLAAHPAQEGGE